MIEIIVMMAIFTIAALTTNKKIGKKLDTINEQADADHISKPEWVINSCGMMALGLIILLGLSALLIIGSMSVFERGL